MALNMDVNVTQFGDDQSEVAIAVNPANGNNIIAAPINSDPLNGVFGSVSSRDSVWVSTNGGRTFEQKVIPLPVAATANLSHGDPTVVFSRDGSRAVYVHMIDKVDNSPPHDGSGETHVMASAVSLDGGVTWLPGGVIGSACASPTSTASSMRSTTTTTRSSSPSGPTSTIWITTASRWLGSAAA
jgi:hypothetical protein